MQTQRVSPLGGPRLARRGRSWRGDWWLLPCRMVLLSIVVAWPSAIAMPVAAQQQGAAIDVGRIDVGEHLAPGERYQLPTIRVRNPGTITTEYRMAVQAIAGSAAPDEAWFSFTPAAFRLEPDERQPVEIVLELPVGAPGGDYAVLVMAQVVSDGDGARVGAAAAARLTFNVPFTPQEETNAWPWLQVLLVVLVALLILTSIQVARRYDIRVERR
jgi:hypothetical protein